MDRYVKQLVDDINQVISQLPEPPSPLWDSVDLNDEGEIEDMSYIESMFYSERFRLSDILQIEYDLFPPDDKLTDNQIILLIEAINALLEYHHFEPAFPDNVSERTKYKLLLKVLKTNQPKVSFGIVGLEFCNFDETRCPIPGECIQCRDFKLEMEREPKAEFDENWQASNLLPTKEEIEKFVKRQKADQIRNVLQNFVPSEKNIEGVFNYCDHWCEQCKFTDRCTDYEIHKAMGVCGAENVEDTISSIEIIFEEVDKMLTNKMTELGIDMNPLWETDGQLVKSKKTQLEVLSETCMDEMLDWVEANEENISEFASGLWNISQKNFKQFNDAVSAVHFYSTFIPMKVTRALNSHEDFDTPESAEKDKHATGKLVLICIDKSINALALLMDMLPNKADELIGILSVLSQLKNGIEKEMPHARGFIRKGLDE